MSRMMMSAAVLLLGSSAAVAAADPQHTARSTPPPTDPPPAAAAPATELQGQGGAYFEFLRGRLLEGLGRVNEALEAYERAAKLDPQSSQIRAEVAALYARQNRPSDAVTAAKAALKLDPDDSEAHWVLGTVYAALIDARAEEEATGTSARARRGRHGAGAPSSGESASPSADAASAGAGELPTIDEAIEHLEKARPDRLYDNGLHLTLGRLYLEKENWPKAIEVTSYVFEREGSMDSAYLLAQAYDGSNDRQKAINTLEEALAADPEYPRAFAYLADLYQREHQMDKAADAYGRAAAASPEPLEYQLRQAAALVSANQTAAARDLLGKVAKTNPTEPRALYLLA